MAVEDAGKDPVLAPAGEGSVAPFVVIAAPDGDEAVFGITCEGDRELVLLAGGMTVDGKVRSYRL